MKFALHQKRLSHLNVQRNLLAGLSGVLLLVVLLQTLLLFFKKERTIISPPDLKQAYWVEGNRFSPSYLEEMALYFAHLLLDVTPDNLLVQGEMLLRQVAPEAYGAFQSKLLQDAKRLKKEQMSLHFVPTQVQVFPKTLTSEVTGLLNSYVGDKRLSQYRERYRVYYTHKSGRLFLKGFELIDTSHKESENEN